MVKSLAKIFGVLLLFGGIIGLVPGLSRHALLLNTFRVNTALNLLHLFSGAAALWCALSSGLASRVYFRFFGTIYLVAAMDGFFVRHGQILGHISNNMADTWAHLAIAVLFLLLGFAPLHESGDFAGDLI